MFFKNYQILTDWEIIRVSSSIYGSFRLTLLDPTFMAFSFCYMTHVHFFFTR